MDKTKEQIESEIKTLGMQIMLLRLDIKEIEKLEDDGVEDEYQLEDVYRVIFGNDDSINRYTHHELVDEIKFRDKLLTEYRDNDKGDL